MICVDSGYDIHFAGAAGLDIKGTEVLCHAKTEDEAMESSPALTQLYREQGCYLERMYNVAKRVGMGVNQGQVVHDLAKRRLLRALRLSLRNSPRSTRGKSGSKATRRTRIRGHGRFSRCRRLLKKVIAMNLIGRYRPPPLKTFAAARRLQQDAAGQDRRLPHRRRQGLRHRRPVPPQERASLSQVIVHGCGRPPAHGPTGSSLARNRRRSQGADEGAVRTYPLRPPGPHPHRHPDFRGRHGRLTSIGRFPKWTMLPHPTSSRNDRRRRGQGPHLHQRHPDPRLHGRRHPGASPLLSP